MSKCGEKAQRSRLEGNKSYGNKDFDTAIKAYNASILSSHFMDSDYIYAMGNKSAVLFETKEFQECIDIIKFLYSLESYSKLFGTNEKFTGKLTKRLQNCEGQLKYTNKEHSCNLVPRSFTSSSMTTTVLPDFGNSVLALSDLEPNDTLLHLKPFSAVLGSSFWASHCYTCFKRVKYSIIVPCFNCSQVGFCSYSCREDNIAHSDHECPNMNFLKEIGLFHLSTNILLKFHIRGKLHKLVEVYAKDSAGDCLSDCGFSEDEVEVISLHCSPKIRINISEGSEVLLDKIIQRLLKNLLSPNVTAQQLIFTLSAVTCQMMINASSVMFYDETSSSNLAIGSGIYPEIAKMNHSCYSNTVCLFKGTTATVKATKYISKGSQLFNSYGYDFESVEINERKANLLDQYDFVCCCEACSSDWKRNDNARVLKCHICSSTLVVSSFTNLKCSVCLSVISNLLHCVKVLESKYNDAYQCFQEKKYLRGLNVLTSPESLEELKVLLMPDSLLLDWNDLVKKFIVLQFHGNGN